MFGVASPDKLIAPVGLLITTDVVPVIVLEPLILPEPVAVNVTVVPLTAAPTDMGLFVPDPIKDNVPPLVIELVVVIPALAESVRLNPPVPAVETPLPVSAVKSVRVTLPAAEVV